MKRVVFDCNVLISALINAKGVPEAAVAGNADCIVSGDPDLLALHPFREIPVLSPSDFLAMIK